MSSTESNSEPTQPATPGRVWRFDDFALDTARYELRRGDEVIEFNRADL